MAARTAWPFGAAFLDDLCVLARSWCAGAETGDRQRVFATLRANGRHPRRWEDKDEGCSVQTHLPGPGHRMRIQAASAHEALQSTALFQRLEVDTRRFVAEGASLPGLFALGLCPGFSLDLVGAGAPQGAFVLHNADVHPDPTWRDRMHPLLFPFGRQGTMERAVEAFLDALATIEAHAPTRTDPLWVCAHPAGQYKERLDWVGGPVQARDEAAALALVRATVERACEKEALQAFQRPSIEGLEPKRRFLFDV